MSVNNEQKDDVDIKTSSDLGDFFFEPPQTLWPLLSVLLAIVLFSAWTLRSGVDVIPSIAIISSYAILSLISTRFNFRLLSLNESETGMLLEFTRAGVSWKYLFYAILGSAIPILLPWFVLSNSIINTPEISQYIMLVAMILYIAIIPILPSLANVANVSALKTKAWATFDHSTNDIDHFELDINELDGYWYSHRADDELIELVRIKMLKMFHERLSIDSS